MTETKQCQNCKEDFTIEPEDFDFYKKFKVPVPNICPLCRFKWRALWRNETTLYNRKCGATGKGVISMYNPNSPYTVYSIKHWESDEWDPFEYGKNYDKSETFLNQYKELLSAVPKRALFRTNAAGENINSEYINYAGGCKNCYLLFNAGPDEDVSYSRGVRECRECLDIYYGIGNERCYECINIQKCNGVLYSSNVVESIDSWFLENCSNCLNCFGCVNIRNKSYQFFNEQLSKEEYQNQTKDIFGSYEKIEQIKKKFNKHRLAYPMRATHNLKTENSTGDYLTECNNVKDSFEVSRSENCKYAYSSKVTKDSLGITGYGFNSELLLECIGVGYTSNAIGCACLDKSQDVEYSFALENCKNCFGCDGLKNAEYCILNKKYSKEEYLELREYIIKELVEQELYGLCPPPEIAPFAYNETIAQNNFPLTKNEAVAQGYRWEDNIQETFDMETLEPQNIPDNINDVNDSILNEVLKDIENGRNYKIISEELLFYRKMMIPIPRKSFFTRHQERIERRGPYKFWNRQCAKTGKDIITNIAPDRPEIVYADDVWRDEII